MKKIIQIISKFKVIVMSENEDDLLRLIAALIVQIILNEDHECNRLCTHF